MVIVNQRVVHINDMKQISSLLRLRSRTTPFWNTLKTAMIFSRLHGQCVPTLTWLLWKWIRWLHKAINFANRNTKTIFLNTVKKYRTVKSRLSLTVFSLFITFFFIIFAPTPHSVENRFQTLSQFCQGIFYSWRYFGIYLSVYESVFFHITKLSSQNLLGNAADWFFQLSKTLCPRQ